jgi:hypothetical protein
MPEPAPVYRAVARSKSRSTDPHDTVTVCRDVYPPSAACTLLEAREVDKGLCVARGIWVPQDITPFTEVGGLVNEECNVAIR